jgi:hypothetical protein
MYDRLKLILLLSTNPPRTELPSHMAVDELSAHTVTVEPIPVSSVPFTANVSTLPALVKEVKVTAHW